MIGEVKFNCNYCYGPIVSGNFERVLNNYYHNGCLMILKTRGYESMVLEKEVKKSNPLTTDDLLDIKQELKEWK